MSNDAKREWKLTSVFALNRSTPSDFNVDLLKTNFQCHGRKGRRGHIVFPVVLKLLCGSECDRSNLFLFPTFNVRNSTVKEMKRKLV